MTFPCVSRVQSTSTLTSKNQSSVSMQPDSNMPQQPTFCSPHGLLMTPVTQFQQQTYILFLPNPPTQPQPTQPQLASSLQHPKPVYPLQSSRRPNPNPGSFEVTLLHLCDPRVSTCYGADNRYEAQAW